MKTMIVNESEVERKLLQRILEKHDMEITEFSNGRKALEHYKAYPADLIILDWSIPELDGISLSRAVKEFNAILKRRSYIIMISSKDEIDDMLYAMEQGIEDFISKPYEPSILEEHIRIAEESLLDLDQGKARQVSSKDPFTSLTEEHRHLGHVMNIFEKLSDNENDDLNIEILQKFSSVLVLLDITRHHGKERLFMNYFVDVLSDNTKNWFTGISDESFTRIHEEHEILEKLFSDLQGYISVHLVKQKETLYLLSKTINQIDISIRIEERPDEAEKHLADLQSDLNLYFEKKANTISPVKEKLKQYTNLLKKHMTFEENIFFPFAQKYLTKEDFQNINEFFIELDDKIGQKKIDRVEEEILLHINENIFNSPDNN